MAHESSGNEIIDEIDRLCVTYDKAKEYISKINSSITEQVDLWQYRRQIILDQVIQMKSSSSCDFLLPKTQRINELTIEAVEALCRVDILLEQILRIDPKSRILPTSSSSSSFSARTLDTNVPQTQLRQSVSSTVKQQPISNGKPLGQHVLPIPVMRSQQPSTSGRLSTLITQEKTGFKPVISQQSSINTVDSSLRSTPMNLQNRSQYSSVDEPYVPRPMSSASYQTRTPQTDYVPSAFGTSSTNPQVFNYQPRQKPAQTKEKVRLQRIPPGTKWSQAKIDIIDSLSAFYVENLDPKVHDKFAQMQHDLHTYYVKLELANKLIPLEDLAIGDFGVAKYVEDNNWYRARLIMREGHDSIKIVFIDFGNIEVKPVNEFYPLIKLFTDLPAQAIACSLSEAFPRTQNENEAIWPDETIKIFREAVHDTVVEIHFANSEEGTEQWPLHFVRIILNNQSVTSSLNLQQRIEPRPNRFIAEQMAPSLGQQEFILFNVPISEDDFER
ncbi:unnamed protein product [Adineta steineri]|uniref:Tudor domain-containing protein n=1 Tax=Adineta steineri TaxID=433720 RepID=A0A818YTS2_9BILA|nr:unnamed protein product [Adineta steineri]